jgi:hypothetical protein
LGKTEKTLLTFVYLAQRSHLIKHGIKECRRSSPIFDVSYYLSIHSDLQQAFGKKNCWDAAFHWLNYGIKEGRQSHPNFSVKCYLNRYPDLQRAFGAKNYEAAIDHYLRHGIKEGRNPKCSG